MCVCVILYFIYLYGAQCTCGEHIITYGSRLSFSFLPTESFHHSMHTPPPPPPPTAAAATAAAIKSYVGDKPTNPLRIQKDCYSRQKLAKDQRYLASQMTGAVKLPSRYWKD